MSEKGQKLDFISSAIVKRKSGSLYRSLKPIIPVPGTSKVIVNGKELINFCSNDYLGLSTHPKLVQKSIEYTQKYGVGSKASRLVSGTFSIHEELEDKFATVFGLESTLLFNSGFQANTSILSTLADRNSLILADRKCHNSLVQGAILSRATFKRFNHNDLNHLESLLKDALLNQYNRIWIVSETVFSMDGDRCDVQGLLDLAKKYNALFYSDDAHALGVLGSSGLGLNYGHSEVDVSIGTFGKAFGSFGAFIGCKKVVKEYLINFCSGLIYTTSLPPSVLGSLDAALELIPKMNSERKLLHEKIHNLVLQLNKEGFDTLDSDSQIIPIIIGNDEDTLKLSAFLEENGILASAIRPPTVETDTSRIRITITTNHSQDEMDKLVNTLREWKKK